MRAIGRGPLRQGELPRLRSPARDLDAERGPPPTAAAEAARGNALAEALARRRGFRASDRQLMSLRLG
jgi:hypothetical protein